MTIPTNSMREYIKGKLEQDNYRGCWWADYLYDKEVPYCHFLVDNCPISAWSPIPEYFVLPGRSEFHRCHLKEMRQLMKGMK